MFATNTSTSLILISDGIPTPSGAGISQTLANLLDNYGGPITSICAQQENTDSYADHLPTGIIRYETGPWKSWNNRIGAWLNGYFTAKQLKWMMHHPMPLQALPEPKECLVLVSTTVPHKLLVGWQLLQQGYTVVPYFMDDWMATNTLRWTLKRKLYSIHLLVKELLAAAPAWLMISEELTTILTRRYQLKPKPCLVIHNPAPALCHTDEHRHSDEGGISSIEETSTSTKHRNPWFDKLTTAPLNSTLTLLSTSTSSSTLPSTSHKIIYAGSIWPMHADALIAVAMAVQLLHEKGQTQFELEIYTSPGHWAQYKKELQGAGVRYMGWKPYAEIHAFLQQAWLLLCTASFEATHQPFSRSSVQTKLTDYMAVGKPILFVGPEASASGNFVDNWDCGFTINTNLAADIAERLQAITRMHTQYRRKSLNAGIEASTTFSKPVVQQQLYAFLEKHGTNKE